MNEFFEIDFLKNIASIIIIIINLIVWIYFLHKVNIENNQIDINNRKSVIESETDIRNYIYNRITMFFNRDKSIKCDDNIKKYLWITLSACFHQYKCGIIYTESISTSSNVQSKAIILIHL